MIVVRKTLTELLLEVTNEEISSISNEAIKSLKNKGTYIHFKFSKYIFFFQH